MDKYFTPDNIMNSLIEKSNEFINMRPDPEYGLTLMQYKFINTVLAMINARDTKNREIKMPIAEFCRFLGIKQQRYSYLEPTITKLQDFKIRILSPDGIIDNINLFDRSKIDPTHPPTEVSFYISESAKPFVFELTKYTQLNPNILLAFDSVYHMRLYELLKQYVKLREDRILTVTELKELLGLKQDAYSGRWNTFRENIIDPFCKAAVEFSDINVSYETRRGVKNKVISVVFKAQRKKPYAIEQKPHAVKRYGADEYGDFKSVQYHIDIRYIAEETNYEFNKAQLDILIGYVYKKGYRSELDIRNFIKNAYSYLLRQDFKREIRNRVGYLIGILERLDDSKAAV
jgi:plasmid replication initiation protein